MKVTEKTYVSAAMMLAAFLLVSTLASAQTSAPVAQKIADTGGGVKIVNTNTTDFNNTSNTAFILENSGSTWKGDIRYAVEFVGKGSTSGPSFIAMSDDRVVLAPQKTALHAISYTLPTYLAGTYQKFLNVQTGYGETIGRVPLGEVTLVASDTNIAYVKSCKQDGAWLRWKCLWTGNAPRGSELTLEIYRGSYLGDKVDTESTAIGGTSGTVEISIKDKTFPLGKYQIIASIQNKLSPVGKVLAFDLIAGDDAAHIEKLDVAPGDGTLTVSSTLGGTLPPNKVLVQASIVAASGAVCSASRIAPPTASDVVTEVAYPEVACESPELVYTVRDAVGQSILASARVPLLGITPVFEGNTAQPFSALLMNLLGSPYVLVIILLVVVAATIYVWKRKRDA